jgi:hypothetical protein
MLPASLLVLRLLGTLPYIQVTCTSLPSSLLSSVAAAIDNMCMILFASIMVFMCRERACWLQRCELSSRKKQHSNFLAGGLIQWQPVQLLS